MEPVKPSGGTHARNRSSLLAATLLSIVGTLNIIYGIGALDDANIFANDKRYILTNLNTLGWVLIVLGVIQLAEASR